MDRDTSKMSYDQQISLRDGFRRSTLETEISIKDEKGFVLFHGKNMTVFGGCLDLLEQSFGITPDPSKHLLLNSIMGIPHSNTNAVLTNNIKRDVSCFMIGSGAENLSVPGRIYNPHNYETKLYNAVPFRCVPSGNDLSTIEASVYRLRKVITIDAVDYIAYYGKVFDPGIVYVEYNGANYTPLESHTVPVDEGDTSHPLAGGSVLKYIQFTLTVEQNEFKEYFRLTHNDSLEGAKLSEIGLVLGADLPNSLDGNRSELAAAELFAKMTSTPVPMDRDGSRRVVDYRIYS
jgi:hypothetical protein